MSLPSESKMDPINSFLGRLLCEEITPVVMVLSTPLVEEACQRNGLSFVEMLRPFSLFNKLDVPVRTASDQPYRLQMFKLRLVYASDIHQQHYEVAEEHLKEVISNASEKILSDLQSDPPQLETVLSISEADSRPLWIQTFNKELIRTLAFSEHEAFDHPVACLLVVSSKDDEPINRFVDLFNTDQLPSLLNEGAMDPKILKHYLLLHDNLEGTPERAASILAAMRSTFGTNDCRLLSINSAQDEEGAWKDNPWASYKTHASDNQNITCYLNMENADEIKDFMHDLSSKHIIPYMEQKIRILNQQVSATRKGFRNQIKNLWWRKGKEDMPDTPNGPIYSFSSIESQMRVLGDYAFMLRDYELALSNYRLLSTDYKLDKAWKRYAGVQEMLGLSYFMLDQSRKEAEYCMENAFSTYLKFGSSGQRNATRCGLWWAEMLKAREQHREAASVYFRISNEEPSLHAAVLLEQASYCYVFSSPPMIRKYGFHLVLAGNRYYISDQRQHAIRTYRNALCVYEGHAWNYIRDHIHFNIGRWYAFLGIFDVAIKHMLEVLACSHQSLTMQDLFLNDFLHTAQNMGKTFEVCKLQLPVISMSSLKVVYEDHHTYASSSDVVYSFLRAKDASSLSPLRRKLRISNDFLLLLLIEKVATMKLIAVSEDLWQSLEEEMVPSMSSIRSNWLESQLKLSPLKRSNDSSVCVTGEAIKLDLEFKNPLQISISASGISLICELSARSEATEIDRSASDTGLVDDIFLRGSGSCRDSNTDLVLSEVDLVLGGGETKMVQLDVTPKVEGMLKIVGVRWMLSGSVVGYHYFEFDAKKKQKKEKRGSVHSLRRSNLNFIVVKGLPKLEGCVRNLPEKVHAGDLRLLKLELRNHSKYSVKNMKMKISHPRFLIPGSSGEPDMDFPSCLVKQINCEKKDIPANTMKKSKSLLFTFRQDARIQEEAKFTWPLWFHTGPSGKVSLYISIYYEMENCSTDMTYRTLRMHYDLEILPSLDVSFLITPCPSRWQEFLVRMDIVNRTSSHNLCLHQLSPVGDRWEISSLPLHGSICPSEMLLAGQAVSCFFKLKDGRKSTDKENKLSVHKSGVVLGSREGEEAFIDICRSPLADFHHHERLHQEMSPQGGPASVDFILISKIHENTPDIERGAPPQLLSYHACYCSISSKSPIWWLMDGPRIITHDFSNSFCEACLRLTIHNSSESVASIKMITSDGTVEKNQSSNMVQLSDSLGSEGGWCDVSLTNDIKALSSLQGSRSRSSSLESTSPFFWCASNSTQFSLGPDNTAEVPLKVCIVSPGTYDLSNFELLWKLSPSDSEASMADAKRWSSGVSQGHPLYLSVLQSPS